MAASEMITFPGGVLGLEPVRLPIIARGACWLAVAKPAGLAVGGDAVDARSPDLGAALVAAIAAGKPQLARLGVAHAARVHYLDADASGVVVLALSPEDEARMRNAVGSRQWEFVFDLIAQTSNRPEGEEVSCNLPLLRHAVDPRVLVSHAAGKRCETRFKPIQTLGRWTLWEARTRDNRPHQVRVHAAECGLHIPGETTYGSVPRIFLSDLKPRFRPGRNEERPLHATLALHLREIFISGSDAAATHVTVPRPKSLDVLLHRLNEVVAAGPRVLRL